MSCEAKSVLADVVLGAVLRRGHREEMEERREALRRRCASMGVPMDGFDGRVAVLTEGCEVDALEMRQMDRSGRVPRRVRMRLVERLDG